MKSNSSKTTESIEKLIKNKLKKYKVESIEIQGRSYDIHVFSSFESINLFEGILFKEVKDRSELTYLLSRYWAPHSGYVARLCILKYGKYLYIRDTRNARLIRKTIGKINEPFIKKLKKVLSEPSEENIGMLFDRTDIIEEFYKLYKKAKEYILSNIKGISDERKKEEFVENFMMQMLTLWYLQERGFFNNDPLYLVNKFKELKSGKIVQKKLDAFEEEKENGKKFNSYYDFLRYFFEKISDSVDSQYYEDDVVGKVVVIGPAVFLNGGQDFEAISIPDECFYKEGMTEQLIKTRPEKIGKEVPLLNFLESRDWTEGNIDEYVLGAIYEKLVTEMERKSLGTFYTPETVTQYMCKNTIEPYLVDRINMKFARNFTNIDEIVETDDAELLIALFEELKEIKVVDPAVGSAHFLESAINVLLSIYEKIWNRAKELDMKKGMEITVANTEGRIENLNLLEISDEEQFRLLVKFHIILSRNVYGVDINPNALKIARARLFLMLAKHFDARKSCFIRFPNVHFNLRDGNSLLGYLELKKDKKPPQLDLSAFSFGDDEEAYIRGSVEVVSELRDYLSEMAKVLKIGGDVPAEIEDLNRILAKRKISWDDFEKILRTKEKLIKILIASLNSRYAKPLHTLLNDITRLFNEKLDSKFAEEHDISIKDLKKIKTFHWIFEFPEVFIGRGGFDVVVGNPPYGRIKQIVKDEKEKQILSQIYSKLYSYQFGNLNLYKLFLERSYNILKSDGYFSMIFPSPFLGERDSSKLRKLFFEECEVYRILEFPERTRVFEGNTQAVCILFYKRKKRDNYEIKIKTNISREEKAYLESLSFISVKKSELKKLSGDDYRIPLFYNPKVEWGILQHISKYPPFKGDGKVPSVGKVGVGHLDETFDEDFMSDEPGDDLLIKGIHLDRYFVNLDPNGPKPRWIVNKEAFFKKKQEEAKEVAEQEKIIGRNTINKASKPRLRFALLSKGYVITNAVKFIVNIDESIDPCFLISLLNSKLLNWRFELCSSQNNVRNYEIEALPIPRIPKEEQKPFIILAKYMLFLKQYQNYFAQDNEHLKHITDYFDNLIDCLVYELYLGDVIKIPVKQFVENKLKDIDLPDNLLNTEEKEREETFQKIEKVFYKLKNDKNLSNNLHAMELHPWVKTICEALANSALQGENESENPEEQNHEKHMS